jgi:hypothetical protein
MSWPLLMAAHGATLDALAARDAGDGGALQDAWVDALAGARKRPDDCPTHRLIAGFGLRDSEVALVLLLGAAALSEVVARQLETVGGPGGVPIWLAQALIPDLSPGQLSGQATLRRFQLIEADSGDVGARLRLAEAVRDWLLGMAATDPLCTAYVSAIPVHVELAEPALVEALAARLRERVDGGSPLLSANGHEPSVLAAGLAVLGLEPFALRATDIPDDPVLRDRLARAWSRDAALGRAALLIDADGAPVAKTLGFAARVVGHVVLIGLAGSAQSWRAIRPLHRAAPDPVLRWAQALGRDRAERLGDGLERVARQFRLNGPAIDSLIAAHAHAIDAAPDAAEATRRLWHAAARAEGDRGLAGASLVEPLRTREDLILPRPVEASLHRLQSHVRHAAQVFGTWGFGRSSGRGRGVAAMFAGPSGTGKTMAAEVLARELDLRMLVIDLSQIISKFVGETSKNIAAAFDLAERSGAVMVWNEGDAIWGTRGSVGHAIDRHINAEVGDLLQRIEAFEGFTIVTTNLRHAIDPAFLRRFRFVIDFPMPSDAERLRIWQRAFPTQAPVDDIDWRRLAAYPLTGAAIANIALACAFSAAEHGGTIGRALVAQELVEELRKSDQLAPMIDWGVAQ